MDISSSRPLQCIQKRLQIYGDIARGWIFDPTPNLLSKFFAETSACAIFHFIGSVSPTPWANGIVLMVLVYYTAKTSGAHLNPALSLTFMLLGHTNPIEMLVYWLAQMIGCMCGALWLALLVPGLYIGAPSLQANSGIVAEGMNANGCFYPGENVTVALVFGWEAFCTFCFILPIFSVVWYTLHKKGYGNTGPLMVGLSLIANAMAAGPYTGAALNPARVLASPAVFTCDNKYLFYYVAGELLGASLVPIIIAPWYGISPKAWYIAAVPEKAKTYFENVKNKRDRGFSVLNDIIDFRELLSSVRDSNHSDGACDDEICSPMADLSYHRSGDVIQLTLHPQQGHTPTKPLDRSRLSISTNANEGGLLPIPIHEVKRSMDLQYMPYEPHSP